MLHALWEGLGENNTNKTKHMQETSVARLLIHTRMHIHMHMHMHIHLHLHLHMHMHMHMHMHTRPCCQI